MQTNQGKIASLELMRIIAMFAVFVIHCGVLLHGPLINETPWLAYIVNQSSRFAVPFFFVLSGYLIYPKLLQAPLTIASAYSKPLLKVWAVWSLIYLLNPMRWQVVAEQGYISERLGYVNWLFATPLNALLEGGFVHLWFIPALLMAVFIIAFCLQYKLQRFVWPIAISLYLYGLLAGSYVNISDFWSPFFTRNGPFMSTLFVLIGFAIRQYQWRLSTFKCLAILLFGMLLHFSEAYFLSDYEMVFNSHDYLFFTPLWAAGLFLLLLNFPDFGRHPITFKLGKSVLGIYFAHFIVLFPLFNIARMIGVTGYSKDAFMLFFGMLMTTLLVFFIQKTPLKKWLIR